MTKRTSILKRLNRVFYFIMILVIVNTAVFSFTSYQIQSISSSTIQYDFPLEAASAKMISAHKSMQSNAAEYLLGDYQQKAIYRDNIERLNQAQQFILDNELLQNPQQVELFNQISELSQAINQIYIEQIFSQYNPGDESAAENIAINLLNTVAIPLETLIESRANDEIEGAMTSSDENELRNDDIPAISYYLRMVDKVGDMQNGLSRYLLNDPHAKTSFEQDSKEFLQWFELVSPLEQDADEQQDLAIIRHHYQTLVDDGNRLFQLYNPLQYQNAIQTFKQMEQQQLSQIENLLGQLSQNSQDEVIDQLASLSYINNLTFGLIATMTLFAIIVLFSIQRHARITIYKPIRALAHAVDRLRQGERNIELKHNNDELGDVFVNVAHFQQDLQALDDLREQEKAYKQQLESERDKLKIALEDLNLAKDKLVTNEKMASLGALVAGVSHEINTPIGIAVTISSTFESRIKEFMTKANSGEVTMEDLEQFEAESLEGLEIMLRSLNKAAELIHSFKRVAIDQSSEVRREFNLFEVINEVLNTVKHQIKTKQYVVNLNGDQDVLIDSYPGPLGQVITNLFNNAVLHGFDGSDSGEINISISKTCSKWVQIIFADNGKGIPKDHVAKVFDPFFTTKMGKGGSGLGMNIVYNIVSGMLGGEISLSSSQDADTHGTQFTINIPLQAPQGE
ncbi:HAMP domain-containing histidine kinase [Shewanella sp. WXL01]|uniref:sensor histidine kinase n=1 Tax=Shewanella sp. WXL01 TaxID=2709721 RepID=UPI00143851BE|nr:HAMP domain-containing sensor histidine kinase [Shewanella sp. WXL01]NKF49810.1 HAMP domain-containing histidine kinase [Shewanella sp. WXL01]